MCIDISSICDFALGSGIDAVNFGRRERFEGWHIESFSKGVNTSMLQELISSLINIRGAGISFQVSRAGDLSGEIIASVEEFEKASDSVEVFVNEVNSTLLLIVLETSICHRSMKYLQKLHR